MRFEIMRNMIKQKPHIIISQIAHPLINNKSTKTNQKNDKQSICNPLPLLGAIQRAPVQTPLPQCSRKA